MGFWIFLPYFTFMMLSSGDTFPGYWSREYLFILYNEIQCGLKCLNIHETPNQSFQPSKVMFKKKCGQD